MREFDLSQDEKDIQKFQSVPYMKELMIQYPDLDIDKLWDMIKKKAAYSMNDNWELGIVKDDAIYISVTNDQHQAIVDFSNGKKEELGKLGLGFFTDEATVNAAWTPDGINNTKLNEMCQIAPFHETDRAKGIDEYNYKPHLDRFVIDHDRLEEVYGTKEFPAMVSKCLENDANSPGGGNQGYNRLIDEMIEQGVLKHDPANSYSREDRALLLRDGTSVTLNGNALVSNTISKREFSRFQERIKERGQDCIDNNTRHPSAEVCKNTKAPGEAVQMGVKPCVLGTEPEKKKFWETLQAYVKEFLNGKKQFTPNDEAQLSIFCRKNLKNACEPDAAHPTGTAAHNNMCNENVKNALRNLEGISSDKAFNVDRFCNDTAERFNHPQSREKANEKLYADAKKSGIKINGELLEARENLHQSTGDYSTMSEISKASKGSSELIEDKDVKDFAAECHKQQEKTLQSEIVPER